MCAPKRRGGMRFRNFGDFNQALLAKQGWRMAKKTRNPFVRVFSGLDTSKGVIS
jgi:hypothetical protein